MWVLIYRTIDEGEVFVATEAIIFPIFSLLLIRSIESEILDTADQLHVILRWKLRLSLYYDTGFIKKLCWGGLCECVYVCKFMKQSSKKFLRYTFHNVRR